MSVGGVIINLLSFSRILLGAIFMSDFFFDPDDYDEAAVLRDVESSDISTRAKAIYKLARKSYSDDNHSKTFTLLETALELFEGLKDIAGQRECLMGLSLVSTFEQHPERAAEFYLRLARVTAADMDVSGEVQALLNAGGQLMRAKKWQKAEKVLREGYLLAKEAEHPKLPNVQAMLGKALRKLGRADESSALFGSAVEGFSLAGDDVYVSQAENDQALSLVELGDYAAALAAATEALQLAKFDDNKNQVNKFEFTVARCLNALGRHEEALEHLDAISDRFVPGKRRKHKMKVDLERAVSLMALGRGFEAAELLPGIITVAKVSENLKVGGQARLMLGEHQLQMGNALDARETLVGALELFVSLGAVERANFARFLLATCFTQLGQVAEGTALLHEIADNPLSVDQTWYAVAIGDLAVHYAELGEVDKAQSYIDALGALSDDLVSDNSLGMQFEAIGLLFKLAGSSTKATNAFNRAMRSYLVANNDACARRVALR